MTCFHLRYTCNFSQKMSKYFYIFCFKLLHFYFKYAKMYDVKTYLTLRKEFVEMIIDLFHNKIVKDTATEAFVESFNTVLLPMLEEKYGKEEVNKLSIDLLDNLSVGRIDDAKFISDRFYSQHYFDEEKSNELNNDKLEDSDSLDDYLDKNLDDSIEDSKNEKSKQISFDDF